MKAGHQSDSAGPHRRTNNQVSSRRSVQTGVSMMTCREFNVLLVDDCHGDLTPDDGARYEAHLAQCSPCVAYLRRYEETIGLAKAAFRHCDDAVATDVPKELVRAILAARPRARR